MYIFHLCMCLFLCYMCFHLNLLCSFLDFFFNDTATTEIYTDTLFPYTTLFRSKILPACGEVAARRADGGGSRPCATSLPAASPLHRPTGGPPPRKRGGFRSRHLDQ